MKTDDWALAKAREVVATVITSDQMAVDVIAAGYRDLASRCVEIVAETRVQIQGRWPIEEQEDDGQATLDSAVRAIRAEFPTEEPN